MSYRRFVITTLLAILLLVVLNLVVWKVWTEDLLSYREYQGGDLARLGYLPASKHYRKNVDDLPRRHIEQEDHDGSPVDIVTIGDSYTNGGAGGRNRYYQDYIASGHNLNVLNIEPFKDLDILNLLVAYYHNGYLDRIKPKYIVISTAERACLEKFGEKPIDMDTRLSLGEIGRYQRFGYKRNAEWPPFINVGNFKFIINQMKLHFSDETFFNKIVVKKLDRPLFSVKAADALLITHAGKDVTLSDPRKMSTMNENLNRLADLLAAKGITLCFMPCVDKYNLYREFIVNNHYPPSVFFEELRKLPKRYVMIDTKSILLDKVKLGEKDIYYADDTHWSWKASEAIFGEPFQLAVQKATLALPRSRRVSGNETIQ